MIVDETVMKEEGQEEKRSANEPRGKLTFSDLREEPTKGKEWPVGKGEERGPRS